MENLYIIWLREFDGNLVEKIRHIDFAKFFLKRIEQKENHANSM